MKSPVEITFSSPGTVPPVYVAASFTEPAWAPLEMEVSQDKTLEGDLIFRKHFDAVEEGEYQYKFRLGPGDWWVLDENSPKATDEVGNQNNVLHVKAPHHEDAANGSHPQVPHLVVEKTDARPEHGDDFGSDATTGQREAHEKRAADAEPDELLISPENGADEDDEEPPLLPHERNGFTSPSDTVNGLDEPPAPLFSHETVEEAHGSPRHSVRSSSISHPMKLDEDGTPLFGHELSPEDEKHMPLGLSHSRRASRASSGAVFSDEDEPDLNDPSIEPFPTDREQIFQHIRRASNRMPVDLTHEDINSDSPPNRSPRQHSRTSSIGASPTLDMIGEEEEESLAEEERLPDRGLPPQGLNISSASPDTAEGSRLTTVTSHTRDFAHESPSNPPELQGEPLTPPMTPKDKKVRSNTSPERPSSGPQGSTITETATADADEGNHVDQDSDANLEDSDAAVATGIHKPPRSDSANASKRRWTSSEASEGVDRPLRSNPGQAALKQGQQEGFFTYFWRFLLSNWLTPFGNWLAKLFGRRKTASTLAVTALVIGLAVSLYVRITLSQSSIGSQPSPLGLQQILFRRPATRS